MGRQQVQANELQAKSVRVIILTSCIPVLFLSFPVSFLTLQISFENETYSQDGFMNRGTYVLLFRPGGVDKGEDVSQYDLMLLMFGSRGLVLSLLFSGE